MFRKAKGDININTQYDKAITFLNLINVIEAAVYDRKGFENACFSK